MLGDVFGSGSVIVSTSEFSSMVSFLIIASVRWLGRAIAVIFYVFGNSVLVCHKVKLRSILDVKDI